jgi:hypothetical protein
MYSYWFILAISVLLESVSTSPTIWYPAKLLAGVGVGAMREFRDIQFDSVYTC